MAKQKSSKPANYVVGYRHPPKATQFTAGKSGNPKGRPKGSRPVGAVLQDIIQQKVPVTENGKTRRIPVLEVMLRRLANDAMRSDQSHQTFAFLARSLWRIARIQGPLGEMLAEDRGDPYAISARARQLYS